MRHFLSEFRAGDGEWQLRRWRVRAAEAHALERPLDVPAGVDETVEKFIPAVHGVDQPGTRLGPNDGIHQRQRLIGATGEDWTDVPGRASVTDESHRVAIGYDARTRTRAEFGQKYAAVEADGSAVAGDKFVEAAGRQRRGRCGSLRRDQPQPAQLQRRGKAERTVDRGAVRRRVEPGGEAALPRGLDAGIDQPCSNAAPA